MKIILYFIRFWHYGFCIFSFLITLYRYRIINYVQESLIEICIVSFPLRIQNRHWNLKSSLMIFRRLGQRMFRRSVVILFD